MAERFVQHHRREQRTDVSPEQRAEYRAKVEQLARKFEIINNNGGRR